MIGGQSMSNASGNLLIDRFIMRRHTLTNRNQSFSQTQSDPNISFIPQEFTKGKTEIFESD